VSCSPHPEYDFDPLQTWAGAVIATVGRVRSAKFAVNARLESIRTVKAALLVVRLPVQLVTSVLRVRQILLLGEASR